MIFRVYVNLPEGKFSPNISQDQNASNIGRPKIHSFLIFAISSSFQWLPGYPLQQAALRTPRFSSNGDRPLNAGWSSTNPGTRPSAASQFALSETSVFCGILSEGFFRENSTDQQQISVWGLNETCSDFRCQMVLDIWKTVLLSVSKEALAFHLKKLSPSNAELTVETHFLSGQFHD